MKFLISILVALILSGCAAHTTRTEVVNPDGSRLIETKSVIVVEWYDYNGALPKPQKFTTSYKEVY